MVKAQNDASRRLFMDLAREELFHRLVYMHAKRDDLIKRRTRKRSAQLLLRRRLSNRVVIAIEQPAKLLAQGLVIRKKRTQHKRLEKPGCMRLMPLHGTGLRAGLHHLILGRGS